MLISDENRKQKVLLILDNDTGGTEVFCDFKMTKCF